MAGYNRTTRRYDRGYQEYLEAQEEERERQEWLQLQANLRQAKKQEQETALARMVNPRGPFGTTLKAEIEHAAGLGSPDEFARYAAHLSKVRGVPLTELNVAEDYGSQLLQGVFNENKYPSAIATGPVPSGRATRKAMKSINWTRTKLPNNYRASPVELTGLAARRYIDPAMRYELGLSRNVPNSKAKKNAAAGTARRRRSRRTYRSRR